MAVTNLGPCEWFVWDIRRSHLMDLETVDSAVTEFLKQQPEGEPPALAQYMIQEHLLTPFQAERLLQGKSQDLVLGPFTLLEAVGTGSMGTVYRAISSKDRKLYAVKVLPRRSMWNARMARRQVTTFEKSKHPAVVPFVDVGTAGAMHFLAWPFVEGESLQNVVQREGRLDPKRAADYALQIAEGLAVCHQNELIHGMLKPSNLLIGADQKIRILDYGVGALLAQGDSESLIDTRSTANVLAAGLDCVSPECLLDPSKQSGAGDQYSLGCVLYFCLAGRLPFEGSAAEKLQAHQMKEPDPIRSINPEVPEHLATIVSRLMQKAPGARYANMKEVIAALASVVGPDPGTSPAPAPEAKISPPVPTASGLHRIPTPTEAMSPIPPPLSTSPDVPISQLPAKTSGIQPIPVALDKTSPDESLPIPKPEEVKPEMLVPPPVSDSPNSAGMSSSPTRSGLHQAPGTKPSSSPPGSGSVKSLPPNSPKESGVTMVPGATQILGKVSRRAASEFSVFDMPDMNFPENPPKPEESELRPVMPKLQPPATHEGPVPTQEEVPASPAPVGQSELAVPQLTIEDRLGKNGTLILTLLVVFFVFLVGFIIFK